MQKDIQFNSSGLTKRDIIKLYNANFSISKIAKIIGTTQLLIRKEISKKKKDIQRDHLYGLNNKDLHKLYESGLSSRKISKLLGVSPATVCSYIKKIKELDGIDLSQIENNKLKERIEKSDNYTNFTDRDEFYKQFTGSPPNRKGVQRNIKLKILKRDGHKCRKCGYIKHLEIHHILPICFGGTDDLDNLISLCSMCHKYAPDNPKELIKYLELPLNPYFANVVKGMDGLWLNLTSKKSSLNYELIEFDGYIRFRKFFINKLRKSTYIKFSELYNEFKSKEIDEIKNDNNSNIH